MNDGICDKCGFKTNTEHHFQPGSHDCTDPGCGYRSFCSDEDGDCRCDICGTEVHDWAICKDLDDNSHEWFCSKCKKSLGKAPHVDIDDGGDGKCDGCGHKMSGTTGGGMPRRVYPAFQAFECERVQVLMTHIGGYPRHYDPRAVQKIQSVHPKLFIAGHSHILKVIYDPVYDLLHVNPGAAGEFGFHKVRTAVRLTIDGAEMRDMEVGEWPRS